MVNVKSLVRTGVLVAWAATLGLRAWAADSPTPWKAAAASTVITPGDPIWMAGYASRTAPSDGKLSELHAKALAIEDARGTRVVLVGTDLIAIPRVLREPVSRAVQEKFGLPAKNLLLNCSHTHCGPVVRDDLESSVMYQLTPQQRQRVEAYFVELRDKLVAVVGEALGKLQPARLGYSHARCGFAMNRRLPTSNGYQNSPFPDGPVDQDVPVLRVESAEGNLLAVAFGYACHNTTTGLQQINADYAGVAQNEIEQAHPGAVALFVMGCGGDQNPYPRGKYEWAVTHGRSLAAAVEAALLPQPKPLNGPLRVDAAEVELEFEPVTKEDLMALAAAKDGYDQRRARLLLAELEKNGKVTDHYAYPFQVIQFGQELTLISLAGEVVVDYALYFKRNLATHEGKPTAVWVAGYSHDVFAYIPSQRVLREGGYEGGGAMRYQGLPGPFTPDVESRIVAAVESMVAQLRTQLP